MHAATLCERWLSRSQAPATCLQATANVSLVGANAALALLGVRDWGVRSGASSSSSNGSGSSSSSSSSSSAPVALVSYVATILLGWGRAAPPRQALAPR